MFEEEFEYLVRQKLTLIRRRDQADALLNCADMSLAQAPGENHSISDPSSGLAY